VASANSNTLPAAGPCLKTGYGARPPVKGRDASASRPRHSGNRRSVSDGK